MILYSVLLVEMTKDTFRNNFKGAVHSLIRLTESLCLNTLSLNYRFKVRPNARNTALHLGREEVVFHNRVLMHDERYLNEDEVVDVLWTNNKVPLWINTSVSESSNEWTTIDLMTSRRLRTEAELNRISNQFPPFHILVPMPPNWVDGVKFDVNWR